MTGGALTLHEVLGRGTQGVVRRGILQHTAGPARAVAVKRLMPAEDIEVAALAIARLRDEAAALASLSHPSIPDFVDLLIVDDTLALLTRFIDGHDLAALLDRGEALPPRAALELAAGVADALDAAWHAHGPDGAPLRLVHRDIKPANLRVDPTGHPWLVDFGLARAEGVARHAGTVVAGVVGTPGYVAPERWLHHEASHPADVFALGLVLLEALGAPPALPVTTSPGPPHTLLDQARWTDRVQERLAELDDLDPGVCALMDEVLAWSPADRPGAGALRDRLYDLAHTAEGPSLRAWASSLPSPSPPLGVGETAVLRPFGAPPAAPRRRVLPWVVAGATAMLTVLAWRAPAPPPLAEPARGPALETGPPELPVAREAIPASTEDAVAPSPPVAAPGARSPAPRPRDRPPAQTPEPAPPRARWRVAEGPPARLRRDGRVRPPGEVDPGLWTVEADFGEGYVPAGEVVLSTEAETTVVCRPWLRLCEVAP